MFRVDQAKQALPAIRWRMEENRDHLIELDSRIGDGDLGLTMTRAFSAADDQLAGWGQTDVGAYFMQVGMVMSKAAPSTIGTLLGTGFIRGGKAVRGKADLDVPDLAVFFRALVDAVTELGRTKPGNKTVVDVLNPVAEAAEAAARQGADAAHLAIVIRRAASEGAEAAKEMIAQHGKAAVFREQTRGRPDPGAAAGVLVVDGFCSVFEVLE